MTKKQTIILLILGIFVLGEVVFFLLSNNNDGNGEPMDTENGEPKKEVSSNGPNIPEFSAEVSLEDAATTTEPNIKVPIHSSDNKNKLGIFKVTASSDGFKPSKISVNQGDVIQIDLIGQSEPIDLSIPYLGTYMSAQPNTTENISFKVPVSGTFRFECRDHCPGGEKITGKLISLPSE